MFCVIQMVLQANLFCQYIMTADSSYCQIKRFKKNVLSPFLLAISFFLRKRKESPQQVTYLMRKNTYYCNLFITLCRLHPSSRIPQSLCSLKCKWNPCLVMFTPLYEQKGSWWIDALQNIIQRAFPVSDKATLKPIKSQKRGEERREEKKER